MSLFQISRIFAPNFWGWLADHTGKRVQWIKLTAFLYVIIYKDFLVVVCLFFI
jgi:hypothetical protein